MMLVYVLRVCVHLKTGSYPVQYDACHSPVMCNRLRGLVGGLECDVAVWAYSATCWLYAEHTIPRAVQVPLVESLNGRRINQLQCLYNCSPFLNTAEVQHGGGQRNVGTLFKERTRVYIPQMWKIFQRGTHLHLYFVCSFKCVHTYTVPNELEGSFTQCASTF